MSSNQIVGLYVNHKEQQCGVYEFGKEIGSLLSTSKNYNFHYCECDSFEEFKRVYRKLKPQVVIYNYHPTTMPWVHQHLKFSVPLNEGLPSIHIGTIHEVFQQLADNSDNKTFDFHIAPDPTLMLKNSIVYKTGRLLPQKVRYTKDSNTIPVIGSFGFATLGKGFEKIIDLVQKEFDEAIIRLNIPFAKFGDPEGKRAMEIASECKKRVSKKLIQLEINHSYFSKEELLTFLSSNTINIFLYDDMENRGISSATDWALASGRPLAISNSRLFRHLLNCKPSICVDNIKLTEIILNDVRPIEHLYTEFSAEVILWEYETILKNVFNKLNTKQIKSRSVLRYILKKFIFFSEKRKLPNLTQNSLWTKLDDEFKINNYKRTNVDFIPVVLNGNISLNRILDNSARLLYSPIINFLEEHFPDLIAKKIPEANIQQAFVLDTAVRLAREFLNPKILAIGSYEDTAVEALKLLDYHVEDIDPIINYDLGTFITKPTIKPETYDVIVSTSVIEHVFDDEQFMKDIQYLLKVGGYAILTCDYKDQYKKGDDIPAVDYRFYTQSDLKGRIMESIPSCRLVNTPEWDCEHPDFILAETYNYTFASIVVQKIV